MDLTNETFKNALLFALKTVNPPFALLMHYGVKMVVAAR